ncbi:MAG: hypothetical protein ACRD3C_25185, partial [Vicinamibacterales bacterium]
GGSAPENAQNSEQSALVPPSDAAAAPVTEIVPAAQRPSPSRDSSAAAASRRGTTTVRPARPTPADVSAAPAASETSSRPAPRFREVTVPANTALSLELLTAVSSETAQVETPVRGRLRQDVVVDGYTALPAGAVLTGNVIDVARAGRVQGRSRVVFRFTEVEVGGGREDLRTNPVTFEGEATKSEDATKIGAGAVGGAIIGGILGGGSGAAKGAAIGGAAGTGAVLATRGREVTLEAGTDIAATLATPFFVQAPVQ